MMQGKTISKESIDYKINEIRTNGNVLSILCQEAGKKPSSFVDVPVANVRVTYSDKKKKPEMRLETTKVALTSWHRLLYSVLPTEMAHISVPRSYEKVLGKYIESSRVQ